MKVAVIVGAVVLAVLIAAGATVGIIISGSSVPPYGKMIEQERKKAEQARADLTRRIEEVKKLDAQLEAANHERQKIAGESQAELEQLRGELKESGASATQSSSELQKVMQDMEQQMKQAEEQARKLKQELAELQRQATTLPAAE
jgi:uncharacterized protein (DUF3084 family)